MEGKQNYLSFLVTEYGHGAASQSGLSTRGNIGVISVQFSDCRPLAAGQSSPSGLETGFGPPLEVKGEEVHYEVEPPHDFVRIRYSR